MILPGRGGEWKDLPGDDVMPTDMWRYKYLKIQGGRKNNVVSDF